jgi:hypothetical protein
VSTSATATQLAETKSALEGKLEKLRAQHEADTTKSDAMHSKQLKAREMEVSQLEHMHSAVKAQLEQRVAELEGKLSKARDAARASEVRRAREAEGFTSDVTLLRQQLAAVDRKLHQMRLASRLADDERLDGLLRKVATKGAPAKARCYSADCAVLSSRPGMRNVQHTPMLNVLVHSIKVGTHACGWRVSLACEVQGSKKIGTSGPAAGDLKRVKQGLLSMESRLRDNVLQPSSSNLQTITDA